MAENASDMMAEGSIGQDIIPVIPIDLDAESDAKEETRPLSDAHCSKVMLKATKGKNKDKVIMHYKCSYCSKTFQGPSNSTALKHLRSTHAKKCPELKVVNKTESTKHKRAFFDPVKMKLPFDADTFMGKLLTWIIKTDQSFSTVDNEYFQNMLDYLQNDISIHSRRTIMRRLEELYIERRDKLKSKLQSTKSKYSITCDVWTSKNQLSFFGITIHYIDEDWQMQEGLLSFKYLEEEHDGLSLCKAMMEVLEDFGIAERLLGVTADNASNNTTMLSHMEQYYKEKYPNAGFSVIWNQIECLAHVLNLGAQQILKEFKEPIDAETYEPGSSSSDSMVSALSRLSFLCRKIRLSPKMRRLLKKISQEQEVEHLVPIIDVATRWNSTYDMLVRALRIKDVFVETIYQHNDNSFIAILLTEDEWKCINQLVEILEPLKQVTLCASANSHALCITNVIPMYNFCVESLSENMQKFEPEDDIYIGIEAAVEKLTHYYDKVSPMVGIALILDPRFKKDYLKDELNWQDDWVESVMDHFNSAFVFYKTKLNQTPQSTAASSPIQEEKKANVSQLFTKHLKRKRANPSNLEEEHVRYFNAPLSEPESNALEFWKGNSYNYPIMSAMAKDYLTVQASSVSAERAFSSGTDLVTPDRCRLGGKTIEMTQFLKFNLK